MPNTEHLKEKILSILAKSPVEEDEVHAKLVLTWMLKIKPDADVAMQIAALSHDIDRAMSRISESQLKIDDYNKYKEEHALRSADFVSEILKKESYPEEIIKKVSYLVSKHETGGDEESDILKDADSLAYFEYNIPFYLKRNGIERTMEKIKFMYTRLSPHGKELANNLEFQNEQINNIYNDVVSILNNS